MCLPPRAQEEISATKKSLAFRVMDRYSYAIRLGVFSVSAGLFVTFGIFCLQYVLAQPPGPASSVAYGAWYYGLLPVATNIALAAGWVGILGWAIPRPRRIVLACLIPLNFSFLLTSNVLAGNPALENLGLRLEAAFAPTFMLWDVECLSLFITILFMTYIDNRRSGILEACLRMLQVGALSILPLGLEIYIFFPALNGMWVVSLQEGTLLQWFSNIDLFYSSVAILIGASLIQVLSRSRMKHH